MNERVYRWSYSVCGEVTAKSDEKAREAARKRIQAKIEKETGDNIALLITFA